MKQPIATRVVNVQRRLWSDAVTNRCLQYSLVLFSGNPYMNATPLQACIQSLATIGPPAKRHWHGFSPACR